ncbi:MAG: LOG family protein [Gloeomargaritaceae cyanobacterium C42_A2020_066]|nr:LOG family protein [Gloeomargaritaceae cyanobacterium C42_A2020_066]
MVPPPQPPELNALRTELLDLLAGLPEHSHAHLVTQALSALLRLARSPQVDRLDWKIFSGAVQDMEKGFQTFCPYRHVRKVAIFGSARLPEDSPEYQMALKFAQVMTHQGFMVLTGAGGGIMAAGNAGAGSEHSFGLNIQLPFEQDSNPYIAGDHKLIDFKYFFTRKLFFLRETDALALFPGGFGTQDEAFESLTLCQNGKSPPIPIVLVDTPGGDYWRAWQAYIHRYLEQRQLISPEDVQLYTWTDSIEGAVAAIRDFYRVYHSCRYVGERLVVRLTHAVSDQAVAQLNNEFQDMIAAGRLEKTVTLPEEQGDDTVDLPRLVMTFDPRCYGRLYQFIRALNRLGATRDDRPERK